MNLLVKRECKTITKIPNIDRYNHSINNRIYKTVKEEIRKNKK